MREAPAREMRNIERIVDACGIVREMMRNESVENRSDDTSLQYVPWPTFPLRHTAKKQQAAPRFCFESCDCLPYFHAIRPGTLF